MLVRFLVIGWLVLFAGNSSFAEDEIVRVGAGSYSLVLPKGAKTPPAKIFAAENMVGKMPTNDWWSSLAWVPFSEPHFPHPLAVEAGSAGLRVFYPGQSITANKGGIFGNMPGKSGDDLILGHAEQPEFSSAEVDGFSDWFVTVRFAAGKRGMKLTYGHGSPYVFAEYQGGDPQVTFAKAFQTTTVDKDPATLRIAVNGRFYGLFGPRGSTWEGVGERKLINRAEGKGYCTIAVLPNDKPETLALLAKHAHAHVVDSQVRWTFDPATSRVATQFQFTTKAREGASQETLFALYPHQQRSAENLEYVGEYATVRGKMKLAAGTAFRTEMRYSGTLPALPSPPSADRKRFAKYLQQELDRKPPAISDTYADGKWLGRTASLIPLAEQYELPEAAQILRERLTTRLEDWLSAADQDGRPQDRGLFYYDDRWGTLIGYPASYGSDVELNDHHFHYGYFVKAAAEAARHDAAWADDARWGGMVKLLIRDMASWDRKDSKFPFLRNFDPYAGHSWASGHAKFGDGNNNESSSEAMNAWCGLILWGEATGDRTIRDLGIYLYTTELNAVNEYWFDVHGDNRPAAYTPSVVTMVWGGKGVDATWFSARPEHIHGINWLPMHGGSLYLGYYPSYVDKNYAALVEENGGTNWKEWSDIIWMYHALSDADDAYKLFDASVDKVTIEGGNTPANAYHWITALQAFGRPAPEITADYPIYAVFRRGSTLTYCVQNLSARPQVVTFSDGYRMTAEPRKMSTARVEKAEK